MVIVTPSRTSTIALLYRVSRFWRMIGWSSSGVSLRVWFHVPRPTPVARRENMRSDSARLKFRMLTGIADMAGSIRCRVRNGSGSPCPVGEYQDLIQHSSTRSFRLTRQLSQVSAEGVTGDDHHSVGVTKRRAAVHAADNR